MVTLQSHVLSCPMTESAVSLYQNFGSPTMCLVQIWSHNVSIIGEDVTLSVGCLKNLSAHSNLPDCP